MKINKSVLLSILIAALNKLYDNGGKELVKSKTIYSVEAQNIDPIIIAKIFKHLPRTINEVIVDDDIGYKYVKYLPQKTKVSDFVFFRGTPIVYTSEPLGNKHNETDTYFHTFNTKSCMKNMNVFINKIVKMSREEEIRSSKIYKIVYSSYHEFYNNQTPYIRRFIYRASHLR